MFSWLSVFIVFAFCFSQKPCEGHCLSQDELNNIMNDVKELEFNVQKCKNLNENLNSQIYMYIQKNNNDSLWLDLKNQKIDLLENRIKLHEDLTKEIQPKWYENKWLYFFGGILITTQTIKLASELAD